MHLELKCQSQFSKSKQLSKRIQSRGQLLRHACGCVMTEGAGEGRIPAQAPKAGPRCAINSTRQVRGPAMSTSNHRERPNSPWSVLLIDAAGNSGLREFTTSIRIAYLPNHHSNTIQGRLHTCSSPPIPREQRAGSTVGRVSGEKTGSQLGGDTSTSTLRERERERSGGARNAEEGPTQGCTCA